MADSSFLASIHSDYLPFISIATDEELGRFVRAQIATAQGEDIPPLDGMAKALFDTHVALMARLEASRESGKVRGRSGGAPHGNQNAKKQSSANEYGVETNKNNQNQSNEQTNQSKNKPDTDTDTESVTGTQESERPPARAKAAAVKTAHGEFGWVKLTDAEYQRLLADYGEDVLAKYIAVVDEYVQQNGNKNKYRDWNLILRKAIRENWGGSRASPEACPSPGSRPQNTTRTGNPFLAMLGKNDTENENEVIVRDD